MPNTTILPTLPGLGMRPNKVRRIYALIALGGILAAAALGFSTAPAHATPGGFLQGLSEADMTITNLTGALKTGYMVCGALNNGYSEAAVSMAVLHDIPSLTAYQAGYLVGLAERELCDGSNFGAVKS